LQLQCNKETDRWSGGKLVEIPWHSFTRVSRVKNNLMHLARHVIADDDVDDDDDDDYDDEDEDNGS